MTDVYDRMQREVFDIIYDNKQMTEEEHLDKIRDEVYEHLRSKQAAPTCRNIIQAMCELHYADWLGHDDIVPTCPYEHQANGT